MQLNGENNSERKVSEVGSDMLWTHENELAGDQSIRSILPNALEKAINLNGI